MNFDPITYNEAAQLRAHFLLLNGDPAALKYLLYPGITGAALQTWLATPANLTAYQQLLSAPAGAAAICASGTAMAAVAASSTAMTAVAASSTAMAAVIASSTAMTAVAASSTAMAAVAASSTAMAAVAASSTAMAAVAASSTAMTAVAASSTAMAAVNASDVAMNALYASLLVTKVSYTQAQVWANEVAVRSGISLFVRLTTKGTSAWGEGNADSEWVAFDGTPTKYSSRAANPYNHTDRTASPRLPMRRCASSLSIRPYAACEVAFIALNA